MAIVEVDESPRSLERRYFSSATTLDDRMEILRLLGLSDAPDTLDSLMRIFRTEKRFDFKMKVLEVLADMDGQLHGEKKLTLLALAVAPPQPKLVRESALTQLDDDDDPRAIALIRGALRDPDHEVREMAADFLRDKAGENR